ncbi:MAG: YihY/virulence factor BrkB family protein [Chthoniobacteraceae bacterium]
MNLDPLRGLWRKARAHSPRWLKILGCTTRDFMVDHGPQWSAAVAFYSILSLFPLALAGVSIAAWFVDPQWAVGKASEILGEVTPRSETIRDIIGKAVAARGQTGLLSFVLLLEPMLSSAIESIPAGKATAFAILSWTLPALLLAVGFFGLYKFVPRHRCNWQSALLGSLTATALILGARPLFAIYVGTLAGYRHIYGWLAIGIVLLVWAQIVAMLTLFCGELASHIQMMAYDGLSGEEVGRRHRVRSPGGQPEGCRRAPGRPVTFSQP